MKIDSLYPLPGNQMLLQSVQQQLDTGMLPHAVLVQASLDLGARQFAHALAGSILGTQSPLKHPDCVAIGDLWQHETETDYGVISQSTNIDQKSRRTRRAKTDQIGREDIAETLQRLSEKAYFATGKVFILERAERLTSDAANALLKFLEEPTPNTTIILTSASRDLLLPTIVSRVYQYTLQPVATDLLQEWQPDASHDALIQSYGKPIRLKQLMDDPDYLERETSWKNLWQSVLSGKASVTSLREAAEELTASRSTGIHEFLEIGLHQMHALAAGNGWQRAQQLYQGMLDYGQQLAAHTSRKTSLEHFLMKMNESYT